MTITNTEALSDERLREIAEWARSEEADCLQDDMPVSASYYADIVKLVAAAKVRANSEGDGEVAKLANAILDCSKDGDDPLTLSFNSGLVAALKAVEALASIPATGGEKVC
jgi:hypothetical protein